MDGMASKLKPVLKRKTLWQYCWRGGNEWIDCDDEQHAETMRGRNAIVREVMVLRTITSCEEPPVTVFSK